MGKMFGNLSTEGTEEVEDRLGGAGAVPTDFYNASIKMAYAGESQGGAQNVTVIADLNGKEMRETIYVTNKKGENFYNDKKDASKKHLLPGFVTVDDLCLLITGEGLADQETETKKVKVYDFEERKEIPTDVPVLVNLLGGKVGLGVLRKIEDKNKKNESSGEYEATGETRTINTIDKVFHPETKRTVVEYRQEVESPEFHNAWLERNKGKDRDASSKAKGGAGASGSGRPGFANQGQSQKKKLFGN